MHFTAIAWLAMIAVVVDRADDRSTAACLLLKYDLCLWVENTSMNAQERRAQDTVGVFKANEGPSGRHSRMDGA